MIPTNDPTPVQRSPRRRIVLIIAAAAAAVVLVGGVIWTLTTEAPPPPEEPPEFPSLELLEESTAPAIEGDPAGTDAEQAAWATEQINADLAALTAAYAADDRDTYMGLLVPGANSSLGAEDGALERDMGLYYDNMRVMQATTEWVLLRDPEESTVVDLRYEAKIGLQFCLAPTDPENCLRSETDYIASWDLDPEAAEQDLGISSMMRLDSTPYRPQPWEVSPLQVAVREGVLVAATTDAPYDPLEYVAAAQAAAAAAEPFAASPVGTYPVFLASDDQFGYWYGSYDHGEALGYAAYTMADTVEANTIGPLHLVVAADRLEADGAEDIFTHESGHVATLQGATISSAGDDTTWYLMEGIAEYVAMGDTLADYRTGDTAALVADGGCTGDFTDLPASAAGSAISGAYGCSYLAVRYLIGEYGQDAFLAFFEQAHNRQEDLDEAAQEAFGVDYATVTEGAAAAIAAAV